MTSLFESRFADVRRRFGARTALVHAATGESRSFDALHEESATRFAGDDLRDLRGRLVLLCEANSLRWPVTFLALHRAGAIVVPTDPGTPDPALDALAESLKAAAVVSGDTLRKTAWRAAPKSRDLFLGKLTSGSTGLPKAHLFTAAQMIADGDAVCTAMDIGPDDLNHAGLPFGHSYALGNIVMPLFTRGVPAVVATSHFPGVIAAEIRRWRATVLPTVPAIISGLHRSEVVPEALAGLRRVISAGSRLAPEDARAFLERFGVRVHNFYGSSETGGIAFDVTGDATLRGDTVGTPMPGVTLSPRRDGRLLVSGPAVVTVGNRRRHHAFGAYPTGDLAQLTPEGVALRGRPEGLVKIGGRRVSLVEVECALRAVPEVKEALADALPGPGGDARLAAIYCGEISEKALRETLRGRIAPWKIPSRLLKVDALPLTPRGKPDRRAVATLLDG